MKFVQQLVPIFLLIILLVSVGWVITEPGWEPAITLLGSIVGLANWLGENESLVQEQYQSTKSNSKTVAAWISEYVMVPTIRFISHPRFLIQSILPWLLVGIVLWIIVLQNDVVSAAAVQTIATIVVLIVGVLSLIGRMKMSSVILMVLTIVFLFNLEEMQAIFYVP